MNPFSILGIPPDSTEQEVMEAAKRLLAINHPDKGGDVEKFKEIVNARDEILRMKKNKKLPCSFCDGSGYLEIGRYVFPCKYCRSRKGNHYDEVV